MPAARAEAIETTSTSTRSMRGASTPHTNGPGHCERSEILGVSITFFQETHFHAPQAPKFSNRYTHNPSNKSKGVVKLLSADIQFQLEAEVKDTEAEVKDLFLKGKIGDSRITLANLYLPNKGQKQFLTSALRTLETFGEGAVIIGGDFNAPDLQCPERTH
ncbi:Hypothetical predicted protein [Pelobates cultripes]|uniref:Endonuclease/exonuclease/phosphatase domain-containing protein n=1 Tax=Pelobates cultripes TaxID=61616 RepID=A0AAD1SDT0_PELCU|nr:Hypothetical predicted protein [Pelobates cultripes]